MHATESASVVAANVMGHGLEYTPLPFRWSDQYSTKIQWQGDLTDHKAVVLYSDQTGALTGALVLNSIKQTRAQGVGKVVR